MVLIVSLTPPHLHLLTGTSSLAPPHLHLLTCTSSIAPPQLHLLNCTSSLTPSHKWQVIALVCLLKLSFLVLEYLQVKHLYLLPLCFDLTCLSMLSFLSHWYSHCSHLSRTIFSCFSFVWRSLVLFSLKQLRQCMQHQAMFSLWRSMINLPKKKIY